MSAQGPISSAMADSLRSAVAATYRTASGAELLTLPVSLAVQGIKNAAPARTTVAEDAFDTKVLFDYWRAQPPSDALSDAQLILKCVSLLLADTAGRPGDMACLDRRKTVFRGGEGWEDADEVSISFWHPKEFWYGDSHRVGDHSLPVPIKRIRTSGRDAVLGAAKIDTFEAMAVLERRCAAMQPQPLYKLEPGAAKGEGGAPAAFPMLKAMSTGHVPSRYSIGRDRVGSIMRKLWKDLGQESRAYILRGSVESIWFEAGVPVGKIVQRSRHKEATFHVHYQRRVPERMMEAIGALRGGAAPSMEEIIRL